MTNRTRLPLRDRLWWLRCQGGCISKYANNWSWYIGPFSISWDHEMAPYTPGEGFGWLPQPRRALRVWFRVFTKVVEIKLWRDQRFCECGVLRRFCDDQARHDRRIAREALGA